MSDRVIYLDMDGVVCDFVKRAVEEFIPHQADRFDFMLRWPKGDYDICKLLGVKPKKFWKVVEGYGWQWWAALALYEDAQGLYEWLSNFGRVVYASTPTLSPDCVKGKLDWIQQQHGVHFRDYVFTPDKTLLAGHNTFLVDDCDANIEKFIDAGGNGIVWARPWNREELPSGSRRAYVAERLEACLS